MPIVLLVVGYLLAVPPLFFIKKIWRNRLWLGFVPEVVGALLITTGWALLENIPPVIINGVWAVGFGLAFPLRAGRKKSAKQASVTDEG